ncbi:MAG: hypothetical protein LBM96_08465 [Methanobrevibacter sp.]|jgi:hypothetical protein|nr:hypothetical protein [Candidatus Methanoflexus mossambicus]
MVKPENLSNVNFNSVKYKGLERYNMGEYGQAVVLDYIMNDHELKILENLRLCSSTKEYGVLGDKMQRFDDFHFEPTTVNRLIIRINNLSCIQPQAVGYVGYSAFFKRIFELTSLQAKDY